MPFSPNPTIHAFNRLILDSGYYLALSHRAISVFYSYDGHATEKLCDNNDEIVGHGVVEEIQYKKEVSRAVTMVSMISFLFHR